jgi:NAD(P)-dependent dehydrogenase (short-subunit alcohol dehydrogenase family)
MGGSEDPDGVKGKVFLITGSGRGLGSALVRVAAERRARVVINCKDDHRGAEALALEICSRHGGTEALVCRADVTQPDQARALMDETIRSFGRVDVLVNTVGAFSWKPVADMDFSEWRSVMASNLDSVYHMCRLAIPHMRKNHWGRIVNLGAVGADRTFGQPKVSAYSAAKAAVVAFSKSLALEEARAGITVNVISPGVLTDDHTSPPGTANGAANLADRVPVGRPGTVDDIVRAVLFFVSPAADFLTGQVLSVAGGWRL